MSKRKYIKIQRIVPGGLGIQQTQEEIPEKSDDIYFDKTEPEIPEIIEPVKETPEIPEIIEPVNETPEIPEIIEPVNETPEIPEIIEPVNETPEIPEIIEPVKVPEIPQIPESIDPVKVPEIPQIPESIDPVKVPEIPQIPESIRDSLFGDILPVNYEKYEKNKISDINEKIVIVEEVTLLPDPIHIFNQKVRDMIKLRNQKIDKITETVKEEMKNTPSALRVKTTSTRASVASSRRR
jgi:hypothetical protein